MKGFNPYTKKVDFELLHVEGIKVVFYQMWQLGLFHEGFEGKFVWYPQKGTLMFDDMKSEGYGTKVGQYRDTAEVVKFIKNKIEESEENVTRTPGGLKIITEK